MPPSVFQTLSAPSVPCWKLASGCQLLPLQCFSSFHSLAYLLPTVIPSHALPLKQASLSQHLTRPSSSPVSASVPLCPLPVFPDGPSIPHGCSSSLWASVPASLLTQAACVSFISSCQDCLVDTDLLAMRGLLSPWNFMVSRMISLSLSPSSSSLPPYSYSLLSSPRKVRISLVLHISTCMFMHLFHMPLW